MDHLRSDSLKPSFEAGELVRTTKTCYEAGELIMAARPYVYCVIPKKCHLYCAHCVTAGSVSGAGGAKLSPCEGCGWDHYCSDLCRQAAWTAVHRHECSLLRAWTESGGEREKLSRKVRMLFRVLMFEEDEKRRLREAAAAGGERPEVPDLCERIEDPGWRRSHEELLSHKELADKPDLYRRAIDGLTAFCLASPDVAAAMPPLADVVTTYGRFRVNWIDIRGVRGEYVGLAMYLSASVLNHRCLQNVAYATTDGTRLELRALRRIDTSLEPIYITYLDAQRTFLTARERRDFFSKGYFFECTCPRCDGSPAAVARDRRLLSARCVLGDDCRKLASCEHCESVKEDGATAAALDVSHAAADAVLKQLSSAAGRGDWLLVAEVARRFLSEDGASLGVCNGRLARVRQHLVAACYELADEWRLGVEQGLVLLDVCLNVCPEGVIYIGQLRSMLGTMMWRGRRFADAAKQLSKAVETLRIAFGPDHPLTVKCRRLLAEAEAECAASNDNGSAPCHAAAAAE